MILCQILSAIKAANKILLKFDTKSLPRSLFMFGVYA